MSTRIAKCGRCHETKTIRGKERCFKCFAVDFPQAKGGTIVGQVKKDDWTEEELEAMIQQNSRTMPPKQNRQGEGSPIEKKAAGIRRIRERKGVCR